MIELKGKYGETYIYNDEVEQSALSQIIALINHPISENGHVRIMPDVHAGAGCVIGYTAHLNDKVVPNLIGVDIGCRVLAVKLPQKPDFKTLDDFIRSNIPHGMTVRSKPYRKYLAALEKEIKEICKRIDIDSVRVFNSIGTLGGGNHFIEVDVDNNGEYWLVVHTGSRNFGLQVAKYHQNIAIQKNGKMGGLEYLEGEDAEAYFNDMSIAQWFAGTNAETIIDAIGEGVFGGLKYFAERVESVHNYIDFENKIVRKGAISAQLGKKVIIPWNMRDGIIIGVGKGNPEWNFSAPHGAGRTMSRGDAKRKFKLEDFEESMAGIWSTCVNKDTLDESPFAYKDPEKIKEALKETVDIELTLKPVYNFKDSKE